MSNDISAGRDRDLIPADFPASIQLMSTHSTFHISYHQDASYTLRPLNIRFISFVRYRTDKLFIGVKMQYRASPSTRGYPRRPLMPQSAFQPTQPAFKPITSAELLHKVAVNEVSANDRAMASIYASTMEAEQQKTPRRRWCDLKLS